jgi:hypothetical protein
MLARFVCNALTRIDEACGGADVRRRCEESRGSPEQGKGRLQGSVFTAQRPRNGVIDR